MNLVIYDSLLPHILGITPHLAWLLANVPPMINENDRCQVTRVLRELILKQSHLQGILLDMEANLIPINEKGSVTALCPDTVEGLTLVEQLLREALAEAIITRVEMEVEAEEIVLACENGIAEDDALYAAKATVVALDDRRPTCCCTGCPETDIPGIALDEDDLDEDNAFDTAKATVKQMGEPYGCGTGNLADICFKCSTWCAHREDPIPSLAETLLFAEDATLDTAKATVEELATVAELGSDDSPEIDVDGFPIEFPRT